MAKKDLMVTIEECPQMTSISLVELCEVCDISADFVHHLMEYEIISPASQLAEEWIFDIKQIQRVKTVLRLQHDLNFNLAGAAIVLDLLEEMSHMRHRLSLLEKYRL